MLSRTASVGFSASRIAGVVSEADVVHARLVAKLTRQITLLQERRQALIAAAVNGQLDIPGAAA